MLRISKLLQPATNRSTVHRLGWGFTFLLLGLLPVWTFFHPSQHLPIKRFHLEDRPCKGCRISAKETVRLRHPTGTFSEWPQSFWQDRKGRIFLTQANIPEVPQVFDSTGAFLTSIGRKGAGPGEYKAAELILGDGGDSIIVIDPPQSRLTILDGNLHAVRSFSVPSSTGHAAVLNNGHIVLNAQVRDPETIGFSFQLFDRQGRRYAARGDDSRPVLPYNSVLFFYLLAPARDGGFWAIPRIGNYQIEHWSAAESGYFLLREGARWFRPLPADLRRPDLSPVAHVYGLWEDESGLLWTVIRVMNPRGPGPRDTLRSPEGPYTRVRDPDREWDTVVEVIDPNKKQVIATQRFDDVFFLGPGIGKVTHVTESDSGIQIRIISLRLTGWRR